MSDVTRRIEQTLKKAGFYLVRQNKHRVYRNDDGLQIYVASSASDPRAYKNLIATLRQNGIAV